MSLVEDTVYDRTFDPITLISVSVAAVIITYIHGQPQITDKVTYSKLMKYSTYFFFFKSSIDL